MTTPLEPFDRSAINVDFASPTFDADVGDVLRRYGVVVVTNVFAPEECDGYTERLVSAVEEMSDGFRRDKLKTWKPEVLPPMVRDGLFQCRLGNVRPAWEVRSDDRIRRVFAAAYSNLRGYPVDDFVTSIDAVNVRPPVAPYHYPETRDWAHFDLTRWGKMYECIQGQVSPAPPQPCHPHRAATPFTELSSLISTTASLASMAGAICRRRHGWGVSHLHTWS